MTADNVVCRAPFASSQYHWVSMLALRSSYKILSYTTGGGAQSMTDSADTGSIGWLTVVGSQANIAASAFVTAIFI
jgi:hypothetical protein